MPPKSNKPSPKKVELSPEVFTSRAVTKEERAVVVAYMSSLPRSFIDAEAESCSLNMTLLSVCQKLAASGYTMFNQFDMSDPEAGGLKLSSLKALV